MTKYESVLIARQDLGASQVQDIVNNLGDVIKAQGGEVVRVDNWGLKNLAYRIKKNRKVRQSDNTVDIYSNLLTTSVNICFGLAIHR